MKKIQIDDLICGRIDWIIDKMLTKDLNNLSVKQYLILELRRVQEAIRTGKHPMLIAYDEPLSF
ncbi:hypothetical protein [Campylobacter sp. RM16190]|uniref:hypothetical protein n=1 Tax=Campylobacter sp. RM16190 TaxID=1705727 RepID=UPI0014746F5A|nr:hypothetical protein [Campylobacter sp. RM16190]